jgi:lipoate-protein ligase A
MRWLERTLATPAENLALDHALLETPTTDSSSPEVLRVWEAERPLVVLGRSSRVEQEVDTAACRMAGVPIVRRVSGGATILAGPGCLMHAVVFDLQRRPGLRAIDAAHAFVLGRLVEAFRPAVPTARCAGASDLVFESAGQLVKCSGNSIRLVRDRLLYHGTLLYDFDLALIPRLLREPPRQPDYRERRPHERFVANLPMNRAELIAALRKTFGAEEAFGAIPSALVESLIENQYGQEVWNLQR